MLKNKSFVNKNLVHKSIIVDFIVNVLLLGAGVLYAYRVLFGDNIPDSILVTIAAFWLVFAIVYVVYDIIYLYQHSKGIVGNGIIRIMAISSIVDKWMILVIALVALCLIGPSKFISIFYRYF